MNTFSMLALSPISAASAIVAICSVTVLYALHHLRAQPSRRSTATLLFWQQAVRSHRTRVPWSRRFTHLPTFLLLASVLLLLAAALSANRWEGTGARDVIVIDAGEETGNGSLLHDLTREATAQLGRLSTPGLIVAGPQPLMLVRPDQPAAVTAHALTALTPQAGASASSLALQAASAVLGNAPGRIIWVTPRATLPDGLADDVQRRIIVRQVASPSADVISGATFVPAPDGAAGGLLRVEISGPFTPGATVQAQSADSHAVAVPMGPDGKAAFENWQADGRTVTLTLVNAPGAPATHSVVYRLPDRRPPVFRFVGDVPVALRLALEAVGTQAQSDTSAAKVVFVAPVGTLIPPDAVAAILIDSDGKDVTAGTPLSFGDTAMIKGLNLEGAVASEGPALAAAATSVLKAGSATVARLDLSAHCPTLTLSSAAVDSTASFPRHAAFPVFVSRLCDALIGRGDSPVMISESRSAADPLWPGPPDAPSIEKTNAADPPPALGSVTASGPIQGPGWIRRWTNIVLAGAVILLIAESLLYAARRIV